MNQLAERSPVEDINQLVKKIEIGSQPPVICLLTGSSGCGKTHLCEALSDRVDESLVSVNFFDSIGIPLEEQMIAEYGTVEKWQEAKTHEWVNKIASVRDKVLVVLEGSFHPQFAVDACNSLQLKDVALGVVSCKQDVWEARLRGPRDQKELIDDNMRAWARILPEKTVELGGTIIDTSDSDLTRNLNDVANLINPFLRERIEG